MPAHPDPHHRQPIRLRDFDYTGASGYFVTICAWQRRCMFGAVIDGVMQLNDCGVVVRDCWAAIPQHFPQVVLDEFVIMPNHVHGILIITDVGARHAVPGLDVASDQGTACRAPTLESFGRPVAGSLPTIIRSFKSAATKRINALHRNAGPPVWQRNYYEHVIRNENDLAAIRQYVADNPVQWSLDEEHPDHLPLCPCGHAKIPHLRQP